MKFLILSLELFLNIFIDICLDILKSLIFDNLPIFIQNYDLFLVIHKVQLDPFHILDFKLFAFN